MTGTEVYELATRGGATVFARLVEACEQVGPYCLIDGFAVNCYAKPVYTLDVELVVAAANLLKLAAGLRELGFGVEEHQHVLRVRAPGSELRILLTADERYQEFLSRAREREVLGVRVRVATLEDVAQGKLWSYSDPERRLSQRKKDELDLIRLAAAYPGLKTSFPEELVAQIEQG